MIIWSANIWYDESLIRPLWSDIKTRKEMYSEQEKHYTSFRHHDYLSSLNDYYRQIAMTVTKELPLKTSAEFTQNIWLQVYEPESRGHSYHDHFLGTEIVSWVHFIKTPQRSFHFLIGDKKVYPENQNSCDFIVFPSWALHAVDNNTSSTDRVIISGNIEYSCDS
tara:strand:+ start:818 stop:1312 length:495 start_codon:yes stop_codon:yes gene_type:complete